MRELKYLMVVVALCTLSAIQATSAHDHVTEDDLFNSLPIVSSVSRISQSTNKAPASVTIIDQELIRASGAQSWVDVFRLVPGFQSYSINANRQAMIPSYQEDADHVGDMIDEYNGLTDRYNADCGDVTYVVEDLQQLCSARPEFGETGWCTRVLANATEQD